MTQPPHTQPPYRQLRRPTTDRMIAGVASGLGRYVNVDPTVVRVLFAVLIIFTGGLAILAYPVLWFLMPEEPAGAPAWPHPAPAGGPVWPPSPPMPQRSSTPSSPSAPTPEPAPPTPTASPSPSAPADRPGPTDQPTEPLGWRATPPPDGPGQAG